MRSASQRIEESVEPGCFVAVAPAQGLLDVEHGGESLKGEGSVAWCACNSERVAVTRGSPSDLVSPLCLLRIDARLVGGLEGLGALDPRPATRSARGEDCHVEDFDGWLSEKRYPASHVAAAEVDGDLSRLRALGLVPVAVVSRGRDFAVVEPDAGSCRVAFSRSPDDVLSLRITGGDRPLKGVRGPIAWCDSGAHTYTVWREGNGEVVVVSAPAAHLGGLFGLGEKIARAHLATPRTWAAPEDLPWDAAQTLRGSGVADATPTLGGTITDPKLTPDGRLVALSAQEGGAFVDPRGDVVCDSKPGVCAQLAPQAWRQRGTAGAVGVAQAPLPFWLAVLGPVKEPQVLSSMVALLGLARRLRGEGFEPTTLEGVKESEGGVEIIGRGGDDAVVAVGLGPKPPFVFPWSDGVPWRLGDDPRIVELKPGERAVLSAEQQPTAPKEARRTVVFRRSAAR